MTKQVEQVGFIAMAIGFLLGMMFVGLLTSLRSPLDYGRSCSPDETEVQITGPEANACIDTWRITQ